MKKIIVFLFVCLLLVGCGKGWNRAEVFRSLTMEYDVVFPLPDTKWKFICIDDKGEVIYIECLGTSEYPTMKIKISR